MPTGQFFNARKPTTKRMGPIRSNGKHFYVEELEHAQSVLDLHQIENKESYPCAEQLWLDGLGLAETCRCDFDVWRRLRQCYHRHLLGQELEEHETRRF